MDEPILALRSNELGQLATTLEAMRVEVANHQQAPTQQVTQRIQELIQVFEYRQEIVWELEFAQLQ